MLWIIFATRSFHKKPLNFLKPLIPFFDIKDKMIKKLESQGLGYHVKSSETEDKLDFDIPMRHVIYGVNPLHPSLISITIGVISSTKVSIKNFTLVEEDSLWSLLENPVSPKITNVAINIDISWCLNSYSSRTIRLTCSIKVSIS